MSAEKWSKEVLSRSSDCPSQSLTPVAFAIWGARIAIDPAADSNQTGADVASNSTATAEVRNLENKEVRYLESQMIRSPVTNRNVNCG